MRASDSLHLKMLITAVVAAATIAAGEHEARRLTEDEITTERPEGLRAKNVHAFWDSGLWLPDEPPEQPIVFLVGNSHTYALPSTEKGKGLLLDPGVTLVDQLESHVSKLTGEKATYWRLSYPNFLPFEMLLRSSYLLTKGWQPKVVVLGLTARNIVRDSEPRHAIQAVFKDVPFRAELEAMLKAPEIAADPVIFDAIHRQIDQSEREAREDQLRSDADRLDGYLVEQLGSKLSMLGKSVKLRAAIYGWLTFDLQETFATKQAGFVYDVVESDRAFNLKCLRAYLKMLRSRGVTVLVYLAPERDDLQPPMLDPAKQEAFNKDLRALLDEQGIPLVDARHVVPNDYWGWMLDFPDRSHFTERGHEILGRFLAEEGDKLGTWKALR